MLAIVGTAENTPEGVAAEALVDVLDSVSDRSTAESQGGSFDARNRVT